MVSVSSLGLQTLIVMLGIYIRKHKGSRPGFMQFHQLCVGGLFNVTIAGIVAVLVFAWWLLPEIRHHPWIYHIHIRYIAPEFLILLVVIKFWLNGDRFPRAHAFFAYPCAALCLGTNAIGFYMAWIRH